MICSRWSLSRNLTSVFSSLPRRSHVDLLRPVDQDIADGRVLEQHLQRAEAERLVEHLVDQPLALHAVEQRVFGVAQVLDDQADFAAQRVAVQVADARQVELVDELAVDEPLEFLEIALFRLAGSQRASQFRHRGKSVCKRELPSHGPKHGNGPVSRPMSIGIFAGSRD